MANGLGGISFGIKASDYIQQIPELRLGDNINDYANMYGKYTNVDGVVSGRTPSLAAFGAVDVTKAPSVFNEKGLMEWTTNEALNTTKLETDTDTGGGFMDWMGSDTAKNMIGLGGLAMSAFGALNNYKAGKQAKKQWEAENARANEIMAMNREKYETYKADKARLNAGYSGSGLAASGVANG